MPQPAADHAAPSRATPARVALTVVVVGLVAMWAYVLYLAIGPGRQPPIDRLDDPRFATLGEARCTEALTVIDALPTAGAARTADERADVIEVANRELHDMLADLDAELPTSGDDATYARAWLVDWRIYLADRERYVVALRADDSARFLVSEKPGTGRHITGWVDEFALANRMDSCVTPDDV